MSVHVNNRMLSPVNVVSLRGADPCRGDEMDSHPDCLWLLVAACIWSPCTITGPLVAISYESKELVPIPKGLAT